MKVQYNNGRLTAEAENITDREFKKGVGMKIHLHACRKQHQKRIQHTMTARTLPVSSVQ